MLTCKDFLKELSEFLDESVDAEVRSKLEKHITECPNCWVIADTTRKTIQIYKGMARIQKLGLEKSARILNGDLLKQNYSSADLVTVYLLPESIDNKVQPLLDKQLKKGARVVAHDFEFKNWTPEKVENIADDGEGRSHTLYLYRK